MARLGTSQSCVLELVLPCCQSLAFAGHRYANQALLRKQRVQSDCPNRLAGNLLPVQRNSKEANLGFYSNAICQISQRSEKESIALLATIGLMAATSPNAVGGGRMEPSATFGRGLHFFLVRGKSRTPSRSLLRSFRPPPALLGEVAHAGRIIGAANNSNYDCNPAQKRRVLRPELGP